ncbi:MAG: hypothetical protein ACI9CD_000693 [Candidatus Deianiraeaceae bacterium]|jgi:hypothetical protein
MALQGYPSLNSSYIIQGMKESRSRVTIQDLEFIFQDADRKHIQYSDSAKSKDRREKKKIEEALLTLSFIKEQFSLKESERMLHCIQNNLLVANGAVQNNLLASNGAVQSKLLEHLWNNYKFDRLSHRETDLINGPSVPYDDFIHHAKKLIEIQKAFNNARSIREKYALLYGSGAVACLASAGILYWLMNNAATSAVFSSSMSASGQIPDVSIPEAVAPDVSIPEAVAPDVSVANGPTIEASPTDGLNSGIDTSTGGGQGNIDANMNDVVSNPIDSPSADISLGDGTSNVADSGEAIDVIAGVDGTSNVADSGEAIDVIAGVDGGMLAGAIILTIIALVLIAIIVQEIYKMDKAEYCRTNSIPNVKDEYLPLQQYDNVDTRIALDGMNSQDNTQCGQSNLDNTVVGNNMPQHAQSVDNNSNIQR